MFPEWDSFCLYKRINTLLLREIFVSEKSCKKTETICRFFIKNGAFVKKMQGMKKKSLFPGKKDILVRKRPFPGLSH